MGLGHPVFSEKELGCLISYITFRKLATNYRALLRKMTNKDQASYDSSPPCVLRERINEREHTQRERVRERKSGREREEREDGGRGRGKEGKTARESKRGREREERTERE